MGHMNIPPSLLWRLRLLRTWDRLCACWQRWKGK